MIANNYHGCGQLLPVFVVIQQHLDQYRTELFLYSVGNSEDCLKKGRVGRVGFEPTQGITSADFKSAASAIPPPTQE